MVEGGERGPRSGPEYRERGAGARCLGPGAGIPGAVAEGYWTRHPRVSRHRSRAVPLGHRFPWKAVSLAVGAGIPGAEGEGAGSPAAVAVRLAARPLTRLHHHHLQEAQSFRP